MGDFFWKKCILCGHHYKVKPLGKSREKLKYYSSVNCLICDFRDQKRIYYKQLLLDLNNEIRVNGEWKKSPDDSKIEKRLSRTIVNMYKSLGPIVAEDVFYRAIHSYWYTNYFTLVRNRQS